MNNYPYQMNDVEPTRKQLWLAAYVALLSRLSPSEALAAADESVELCNQHWASPPWVTSWNYKHNYPVGHTFQPKNVEPNENNDT